ncbi:hypothetical protein L5515_000253 [Caenorhabditis briggsae]|uniref:Uncharacterized protein n=1 Tax=Caenorhabditis briggsae TaxID=6238 RepID=A0AAE9DXU6_CAEBR|nr:hypothetical protein L5515_000253 [Caenorhabditis briggsae]
MLSFLAQCSGLQALLIFLNSCFFILGTQCYQSSYHGSCHGMGYGDSLFESEQSTKPGMSQCSPSSVDVGVRTKCQFLLQMSIQMSRTFEALSDETQLKYHGIRINYHWVKLSELPNFFKFFNYHRIHPINT